MERLDIGSEALAGGLDGPAIGSEVFDAVSII